MFDLINNSAWSAGLFPGWGPDRQRQMTAVVKMSFGFDELGKVMPAAEPAPITVADQYLAGPSNSSLVAASDTVPFKAGGEILLSGTLAPPAPNCRFLELELGLRHQDDSFWKKKIHVFGPRIWRKSLLGATLGDPDPITPLPLSYEYAYGGADPNDASKFYAANPAGRGYSHKGWRLKDLQLPQLEMGPKFITSPTSKVMPAGFGPIPPLWPPRQELARMMSADEDDPCPLPPAPPAHFYNCAPLDQRFPAPFQGGESIMLKGFLAKSPKQGTLLHLPTPKPSLNLVDGRLVEAMTMACDTVLIDISARQLSMVYRAALPWPRSENDSRLVFLQDLDTQEERELQGAA